MFSSIPELENALLTCNKCKLCQEGNHGPTSYNGCAPSPFAVIGEGPGGVEDEYGVPLVGPSGQLLDKALWSVNITRDKTYTSNIIKCRPKGNRTPTLAESQFCANAWLDHELALVKPRVIVALGSVALKYLMSPNARITKEHGKWFNSKYDIPAIATFHPAYLLRLSGKELVKAKWEVFYDLTAAVNKCKELVPAASLKTTTMPDLLALYAARKNSRLQNNSSPE